MSSGWSEFRVIPFEYNDQVRQIDEQLLRLVTQRKQITRAVQYHPPQEVIDEWTASLDLKEEDIRYILRSVQPMPQRQFFPPEELPLMGVVPIMKRTILDSCEYLITHSMQYETESIIHLEIHYKGNETDRVHVVPHLALEVISEQNHMSTRHSSRGGGGETHLSYRVVPALPSSLEQVQFSLVPSVPELEHKMEEVILDQQVDFE